MRYSILLVYKHGGTSLVNIILIIYIVYYIRGESLEWVSHLL
jgi:hypothetical protein